MDSSFLSNFSATLSGVFVAFILDRIVTYFQTLQRDRNDITKLCEILELISKSILHNRKQMDSFLDSLQRNTIKVSFQVDLLVWDSLKNDVNYYIKDISLKYDFSQYFMNMGYLLKLYDVYFDFEEKQKNLAIDAELEFYDGMIYVIKYENLLKWLPEMIDKSYDLLELIEKTKAKYKE